jgi:UrcA family protein
MKPLLLAAVAAASLSLPLPGLATTRVVSVADLDLASPAGHAQAMARIQRAAYGVCREIVPWEGVGVLWNWLQYLDCAKAATDAGAAQLPPVDSSR